MLDGCEHWTNLLDDIVVVASEDADEDCELDPVLHRLSEHRATITFYKA